jgi:hypothetical protein
MLLNFNKHKCVCFYAIWGYSYIYYWYITGMHRYFTLKIDSDIHDSFIIPLNHNNKKATVYWTDFLIKPFQDTGFCTVISGACTSDLTLYMAVVQ